MKSSYVIRAMRFAEQIYPFICDCKTVDQYYDAVNDFNFIYNRKVLIAHGMTRVVLITSDYVLKIDYGTNGRRWGGNAEEIKGYAIAHKHGYAYLFARPTPYMVNECVFCIMPRIRNVDCDKSEGEDVYYHVTEEEENFLYDHFADLHCENYGWKDDRPVIFDYACLG